MSDSENKILLQTGFDSTAAGVVVGQSLALQYQGTYNLTTNLSELIGLYYSQHTDIADGDLSYMYVDDGRTSFFADGNVASVAINLDPNIGYKVLSGALLKLYPDIGIIKKTDIASKEYDNEKKEFTLTLNNGKKIKYKGVPLNIGIPLFRHNYDGSFPTKHSLGEENRNQITLLAGAELEDLSSAANKKASFDFASGLTYDQENGFDNPVFPLTEDAVRNHLRLYESANREELREQGKYSLLEYQLAMCGVVPDMVDIVVTINYPTDKDTYLNTTINETNGITEEPTFNLKLTLNENNLFYSEVKNIQTISISTLSALFNPLLVGDCGQYALAYMRTQPYQFPNYHQGGVIAVNNQGELVTDGNTVVAKNGYDPIHPDVETITNKDLINYLTDTIKNPLYGRYVYRDFNTTHLELKDSLDRFEDALDELDPLTKKMILDDKSYLYEKQLLLLQQLFREDKITIKKVEIGRKSKTPWSMTAPSVNLNKTLVSNSTLSSMSYMPNTVNSAYTVELEETKKYISPKEVEKPTDKNISYLELILTLEVDSSVDKEKLNTITYSRHAKVSCWLMIPSLESLFATSALNISYIDFLDKKPTKIQGYYPVTTDEFNEKDIAKYLFFKEFQRHKLVPRAISNFFFPELNVFARDKIDWQKKKLFPPNFSFLASIAKAPFYYYAAFHQSTEDKPYFLDEWANWLYELDEEHVKKMVAYTCGIATAFISVEKLTSKVYKYLFKIKLIKEHPFLINDQSGFYIAFGNSNSKGFILKRKTTTNITGGYNYPDLTREIHSIVAPATQVKSYNLEPGYQLIKSKAVKSKLKDFNIYNVAKIFNDEVLSDNTISMINGRSYIDLASIPKQYMGSSKWLAFSKITNKFYFADDWKDLVVPGMEIIGFNPHKDDAKIVFDKKLNDEDTTYHMRFPRSVKQGFSDRYSIVYTLYERSLFVKHVIYKQNVDKSEIDNSLSALKTKTINPSDGTIID